MAGVAGHDPLDNAVWHALGGPLARFAEGHGRARRFLADVAPFAGMPDEMDRAAWDDLGRLVGPGEVTALFRAPLITPPGWATVMRWPCRQMTCARAPAVEPLAGVTVLGRDDRAAMLALTAATQPGPFLERTHELGHYVGVHSEGRLVAMAGERLRLDGATEISAVCTDPDHRRAGLAAGLVSVLVARILARHETPFLHVAEDNLGALRVYEALGFTTRACIEAIALRAPA